MRISELSRATDTPVPTLKFYLREGLLPSGDATAVNQADYGERHVRRLRLIRALTDVGGLRLREVRSVLAAIEDQSVPVHELLGTAQAAIAAAHSDADERPSREAMRVVDRLLAQVGWEIGPHGAAVRTLARAIDQLARLGWNVPEGVLAHYAEVANGLAAAEVASLPDGASRSELVERMVIGSVLFEAVLVSLRNLAQEHHSGRRFGRR